MGGVPGGEDFEVRPLRALRGVLRSAARVPRAAFTRAGDEVNYGRRTGLRPACEMDGVPGGEEFELRPLRALRCARTAGSIHQGM